MNAHVGKSAPVPAPDAAEMAAIAAIAHADAGIVIAAGKVSMVRSRLAKRLHSLQLPSYSDYLALVQSAEGIDERRRMISALTTNVSYFFREAHHFAILRRDVLPALIAKTRAGGRLRIWSAGCSNGQEAYSIAMTLFDMAPDMAKRDVRILASDIDPLVVENGRSATFEDADFGPVDDGLRCKYVEPAPDGSRLTAEVRAMVNFKELNLHAAWPMRGKFDIIFCRNVVIYFDLETRAKLWPRFADALVPGGWLFVGHSERVPTGPDTDFRPSGITSYRRTGGTD